MVTNDFMVREQQEVMMAMPPGGESSTENNPVAHRRGDSRPCLTPKEDVRFEASDGDYLVSLA
jgi:hypothetical protein